MCGTPQVETTFSWMAMAATLVTRKRCGLYMASRAKGPRVTMLGVSSVVRCSWADRRSLAKPKGIFLLALEVFITSNLFTWFLVRRKKIPAIGRHRATMGACPGGWRPSSAGDWHPAGVVPVGASQPGPLLLPTSCRQVLWPSWK